jgi:hypothetical protein
MLRSVVASNIQDDEMTIEIWQESDMVGEIRRINGNLIISVYNCPSSNHWEFQLVDFTRILNGAILDAETI